MNTELFATVNKNHEMVMRRKRKPRGWLEEEKEDKYRGLLLYFGTIAAILLTGFVEAL
jgi:hypothetical protein